MFETTRNDGITRIFRPETRWLSTGYAGGESHGPAAYNVTVPEGWPETDLDSYVERRLADAGFDADGPALLTGVDQRHARRARYGPVEVVATAGVSNPAALPTRFDEGGENTAVDVADESDETGGRDKASESDETGGRDEGDERDTGDHIVGTVNVVVGTTRALEPGALANLVAVAAEAKAATLLSQCGSPGTTTDAVVAACDPSGETETFSGSATPVGNAARICVRDAIVASLDARYTTDPIPQSVEAASYGVVADARATVTPVRKRR